MLRRRWLRRIERILAAVLCAALLWQASPLAVGAQAADPRVPDAPPPVGAPPRLAPAPAPAAPPASAAPSRRIPGPPTTRPSGSLPPRPLQPFPDPSGPLAGLPNRTGWLPSALSPPGRPSGVASIAGLLQGLTSPLSAFGATVPLPGLDPFAATAGLLNGADDLPALAPARVLCVQPGGGATGAPCSNPIAYGAIQDAVNAANPGDEVRVAGGTYQVASGPAIVAVATAIALRGGYLGGTTGWATPLGPTNTILDGQGARAALSVGAGATLTLSNLAADNGGIQNAGTVVVDSGSVVVEGSGTSGGVFTVQPGAVVALPSGSPTLAGGTSFLGAGLVELNGGAVAFGSTSGDQLSAVNLELDAGTLGGSGALTVSGALTWTGGTMAGGGTTTIGSGGTLALPSEPSGTQKLDARTLVNQGTITWTGAGNLTLADGAALQNAGTWTVSPIGGLSLVDGGGAASSIQNSGTLGVGNGQGAVAIGMSFANLAGATIADPPTGTGPIGAGVPLQFKASNGLTNAGAITFASPLAGMTVAGTYTQTGGTTTLAGGTLAATTVSLQGGTLSGVGTVSGAVTNGGTVSPGNPTGTLTMSGSYTQTASGTLATAIGGTATGQFGALSVSGPTTLAGALSLSVANGFAPLPGQSFPALNLPGGRSGTFAAVVGTTAGNGNTFGLQYDPADVTLTVTGPGPTATRTPTVTSTPTPSNQPVTFTVNTTADLGPDFTSCAAATPGKCTIREAIVEANALNTSGPITINVPAGTYVLSVGSAGFIVQPVAPTSPFHLTIQGAGAAATIVDGNHRSSFVNVLGGSSSLTFVTIDGITVEHMNGGGAVVTNHLGNVTFSNSVATDNSNDAATNGQTVNVLVNGAGSAGLPGSVMTVENSTITNNVGFGPAVFNGGGTGPAVLAGALTIDKSTISNNTSVDNPGGGIDNGPAATLTITNSTISGNANTCAGDGGGIFNSGSLTLTNSAVTGNTATVGGGIVNGQIGGNPTGASATLTNSTVSGNTAVSATIGGSGCAAGAAVEFGGAGGGIYSGPGATLTLTNSTVSGNTAAGGAAPGFLRSVGGGGIMSIGPLTLTNSTVSGNTSTTAPGGGIYFFNWTIAGPQPATITNSTVSGNSASLGGGIYVGGIGGNFATLTTTAGTLAFNSTGLFVDTNASAALRDTIVAKTMAGANCSGPVTDQGYNLDDGTTCGFGAAQNDVVGTDPLLAPLALNAPGTTPTHALQPGSPAIDVGTCTDGAGNPIATDQRGREPAPGFGLRHRRL